MTIRIGHATIDDVSAIAPLFDAYRIFYGRASDAGLARRFIAERLGDGSSIIILARAGDEAVGFAQLYPSFSSLGANRSMILNDLFVAPSERGRGIAGLLVAAAVDAAIDAGAAGLSLMTHKTNGRARALYERLGWTAVDDFLTYELDVAERR
jgi:GNAT superfamily N-acetyltransferase